MAEGALWGVPPFYVRVRVRKGGRRYVFLRRSSSCYRS